MAIDNLRYVFPSRLYVPPPGYFVDQERVGTGFVCVAILGCFFNAIYIGWSRRDYEKTRFAALMDILTNTLSWVGLGLMAVYSYLLKDEVLYHAGFACFVFSTLLFLFGPLRGTLTILKKTKNVNWFWLTVIVTAPVLIHIATSPMSYAPFQLVLNASLMIWNWHRYGFLLWMLYLFVHTCAVDLYFIFCLVKLSSKWKSVVLPHFDPRDKRFDAGTLTIATIFAIILSLIDVAATLLFLLSITYPQMNSLVQLPVPEKFQVAHGFALMCLSLWAIRFSLQFRFYCSVDDALEPFSRQYAAEQRF